VGPAHRHVSSYPELIADAHGRIDYSSGSASGPALRGSPTKPHSSFAKQRPTVDIEHRRPTSAAVSESNER
jgi:hypothetical protein